MAANIWGPNGGTISVNVSGTIISEQIIAIANQTLFTLTSFIYETKTSSIVVFVNGIKMAPTDYAETSGSSFTLVVPCLAGDIVDVLGLPQLNHVVTTDGDVTATASPTGSVYRTQHQINAEQLSVAAFGGIPGVDAKTAIEATSVARAAVLFPEGAWQSTVTPTLSGATMLVGLPGSTFGYDGLYNLGLTPGALQQVIHNNTTTADFATSYIRRNSSHAGGTIGNTVAALRVDSYVTNTLTTNSEWGILSVLHNYAIGGENVAGYFQGNKYAGAGPTWAMALETIEKTAVNNPTTGTVGLEVALSVNGTDNGAPYGSRVGVDLVLRKYNGAGVAANVAWGFRIQNGGDADTLVDRGFAFVPGLQVNKGFDTSQATVITAAYMMAQGQTIAFNANATRQMYHTGVGYRFKTNAGADQWSFNDNFSLTANGVQLLGVRSPGWTAATGTPTRTTFDTAAVTLPQLAQRVKALIDDLIQHGLIGA